MALAGKQGATSGFRTEICLILAIFSAIGASLPTTGPPTQDNCPGIQLPDAGNGTCVLSDMCSKVACTAPPGSGPFSKITVQANACRQPLKATVDIEPSQGGPKWSHTFEDGEEAAFPMPGIPDSMNVSMKVELKKNGNNLVHFKILQLIKSDYANSNVTFLEGDLHAYKCASPSTIEPATQPPTHHSHHGEHQDNCPDIQLPDGSEGTCEHSDHCSKVICTAPPDSIGPFGHQVLTVQVYGCHQPVKATVHTESSIAGDSSNSGTEWSHTFKDGEKAALPTLPGAPANVKVFLKVELKKNGGFVHLKLVMLFESDVTHYNVTFLEGDLHASKCADEHGSDHSKQCPAVDMIPSDPNTPSKCVYSDHCSNVKCSVAAEGHKLTVGFEANKCKKSLTAKVTIQQTGGLDWSHTLKDGEKAKLKAPPSSFTGGIPVSDASLFVKVKLRETQGNNVNFTVMIVGTVTIADKTEPVNAVLLQGELPISTDDCGTWFSRQSSGVKAAVIVVPIVIIIVISLALVAFFCYKRRQDGTRFMVDIFSGRDKHGMQRLDNEL
ncbi:hypothetical protein ACROYT_G029606 [Oculina patagonica]